MNFRRENNTFCRPHHRIGAAGFTLIEFLIAMAMFVVVGGAVLEMFAKQAPYFTRQQNLVGVNIAMQNAVSQMQIDLANAGTGLLSRNRHPELADWNNDRQPSFQEAPACNIPTTFTYTQACFDKLNILTVNSTIPPVHPTNPAGGITAGSCSTTTGSPFYILPSGVQTPAQAAAGYNVGDQVLLVKAGGGGGGNKGADEWYFHDDYERGSN